MSIPQFTPAVSDVGSSPFPIVDSDPAAPSDLPFVKLPSNLELSNLTQEDFAQIIYQTAIDQGVLGKSYRYEVPQHLIQLENGIDSKVDRTDAVSPASAGSIFSMIFLMKADRRTFASSLETHCTANRLGSLKGSRRRILSIGLKSGGVLGAVAALMLVTSRKAGALCGSYCGYCYTRVIYGCRCLGGSVPYYYTYYACYDPNTGNCYNYCGNECKCFV